MHVCKHHFINSFIFRHIHTYKYMLYIYILTYTSNVQFPQGRSLVIFRK